ncbi:MAG: Ig-like domain-containing protein, partial [Thermoplasmata archaeon]|nr:Ig-like domain-containing protein [Thermoplasmata archaeon]
TYTITILTAATDLAGNTLDGDKDGVMEGDNKDKWVFSFTTENEPDLTGPIVSNVQGTPDPINSGSPLTLTANVDDSTTGGSNIAEAEWSEGASAANAGAGTPMSASDGAFDSVTEGVTATVDTTGWPDGSATLWVRGRDAQGNWGDAVSTTIVVIGPDIIPPQVVTNDPLDGATAVSVSTNIVVTFTEEMDQANTEGAFSIVPAAAGTFSWNAGGDVLTFNPSSDLLGGETYTITILTAATDLAGNTLDGDKDGVMEGDNKDKWVFSFTTEGGGPGAKYAVVVGINKFTYLNDLTYCVNDANEVKTNLAGDGYSVDQYTDLQATKANILTALDDMGASEVAGDYTAFTFSGHGGIISGKCVICPTEGYDITTYIQKAELEAKFSTYDSTHILIFFDSCNSGGMSTLGSAGRLCIMAAASNQYSWDGQPDIANGVWTYFFWEDGYSDGSAGSLVMEVVFVYAKPLAKNYVETNYPPYTMDAQISDGYTGDFYL